MAKQKVVCVKCHRERYVDRMEQGRMVNRGPWPVYEPVLGPPLDIWYCSARATCKTVAKKARRRERE